MKRPKKTDKRKWLKCEFCGQRKPDTTVGPDPYAQDVMGDETPHKICASCSYNSAMDI